MPKTDKSKKRLRSSAKRRLEFGDDYQQGCDVADADENGAQLSTLAAFYPDDNEKNAVAQSSPIILATPRKKKCRRGDGSSGRKHGISMYFSPSKSTTTSAFVTPERESNGKGIRSSKEKSDIEQHVPIYIHKNLNYQRRGEAFLKEKLKYIFDLVEEHYVIPSDFECNRSYGPISGTCFEERVVNAYERGLLMPNQPLVDVILICSNCGELGHQQEECPELI